MATKSSRERLPQPIDKVAWVHVDELKANSYNPNRVAPPELELLKISIIEDDWTQPIVVAREIFWPCGVEITKVAECKQLTCVLAQVSSAIPLVLSTEKDHSRSTKEDGGSRSIKAKPTVVKNSSSGSKKHGRSDTGSARKGTGDGISAISGESIATTISDSSCELVCPTCASNAKKLSVPLPIWLLAPEVNASGQTLRIRCFGKTTGSVTGLTASRSAGASRQSVAGEKHSAYLGIEYEIVDGYHRYLCCKTDVRVYGKTHGYVPTVVVAPKDASSKMMATIRHNRARGTHTVLAMSKIIQSMVEVEKLTMKEICERLQMEPEEVTRLAARQGIPQSKILGAEWSKEWVPAKANPEATRSVD
jgi:hypothetical protein